MSREDQLRWDAKYAQRALPGDLSPDDWLVEHVAGTPPGRALDLACGLGHNAIWLAERGWTVDAVDISPVGLCLAREFADGFDYGPVNWIAADLDEFTPAESAYDLVLVFRFLERERLPRLIRSALRPDGRVIYETFLGAQFDRNDNHLHNRAFALAPGELPKLFPKFEVLNYRETELSNRTVAQLLAERD